jgi:hypothetical protein
MLVFCAAGSPDCSVEWSRAIYPTTTECALVAPNWILTMRRIDKRKPIGAYCEIARRRPHDYHIPKKELHHAIQSR